MNQKIYKILKNKKIQRLYIQEDQMKLMRNIWLNWKLRKPLKNNWECN